MNDLKTKNNKPKNFAKAKKRRSNRKEPSDFEKRVKKRKEHQCRLWGTIFLILTVGFITMIILGSIFTINYKTIGYVKEIKNDNPFPDLYQSHIEFTYDCGDSNHDSYNGSFTSPTTSLYNVNQWLFQRLNDNNSTIDNLYCVMMKPSKYMFNKSSNSDFTVTMLLIFGSLGSIVNLVHWCYLYKYQEWAYDRSFCEYVCL